MPLWALLNTLAKHRLFWSRDTTWTQSMYVPRVPENSILAASEQFGVLLIAGPAKSARTRSSNIYANPAAATLPWMT